MTYIVEIAACTCFGDWPATWKGLLASKPVLANTGSLAGQEAGSIPVACVGGLGRAAVAGAHQGIHFSNSPEPGWPHPQRLGRNSVSEAIRLPSTDRKLGH